MGGGEWFESGEMSKWHEKREPQTRCLISYLPSWQQAEDPLATVAWRGLAGSVAALFGPHRETRKNKLKLRVSKTTPLAARRVSFSASSLDDDGKSGLQLVDCDRTRTR